MSLARDRAEESRFMQIAAKMLPREVSRMIRAKSIPPTAIQAVSHAQAYASAGFTLTDSTEYTVGFGAETFDNDDMWGLITAPRLHAPSAGLYLICAQALFAFNATGYRRITLYKNDTAAAGAVPGSVNREIARATMQGHATTANALPLPALVRLGDGDWVTMALLQTSGGDLTVSGGVASTSGEPYTGMTMAKISN